MLAAMSLILECGLLLTCNTGADDRLLLPSAGTGRAPRGMGGTSQEELGRAAGEASRPNSDGHILTSMSAGTSVLNSHTSQPTGQDNTDGLTDRSSAPSHSHSVSAILQAAGLGAPGGAASGGGGSPQRVGTRHRSQSVHLTPEQMHQARHVLQQSSSAAAGREGPHSMAAPGTSSGEPLATGLGHLEAAYRSEGVSHLLDRTGSDKRNSDTSSLYAGLPTSPSALVIPYSASMSMSRTSANTALSPAPSAARGLHHETSMQSTGVPMSARSLSHTVSRTSYGPSSGRSTAHTHLHHSRLPSGVSTMSATAALASLGAAAAQVEELGGGGSSPPRAGGGLFVPGLSTMLEAPEAGSNSSRELGRIQGPSMDGSRTSHGSHRLRRRSVSIMTLLHFSGILLRSLPVNQGSSCTCFECLRHATRTPVLPPPSPDHPPTHPPTHPGPWRPPGGPGLSQWPAGSTPGSRGEAAEVAHTSEAPCVRLRSSSHHGGPQPPVRHPRVSTCSRPLLRARQPGQLPRRHDLHAHIAFSGT
jgi:hypothetical protein